MYTMTFNEFLEKYHFTPGDAARLLGIPYDVTYKWSHSIRGCAPYYVELMDYKTQHERLYLHREVPPDPEERFDTRPGLEDIPVWVMRLTDKEIAAEIRRLTVWDDDLLRELCYRAGNLEDFLIFEDSDCPPVFEAADRLGVYIGYKP